MTDRTVKVSLVAQVNGYISGLQQAQQATRKFGDDAKAKAAEQSAALKTVGNTAGLALTAFGAVAAAAVGLAIKKFADFDAAMAQVKTLSHATAEEMSQLTDAALTMGQNIGYSATEVAEAEAELVKAGISVADIMGGSLKGALDLAAAGQIDVGEATQIAAEAMTQFGLKGKDVPHIADLLAAGADKALGSVGDLGQALESGGLVAAQFGLSIEETVGTLSAFAQAGLIGETAGTDLRQMLLKLGNPSADAAKTMKDLGISLYDASGQFVGVSNLAGQLKDKMSALDPATRNAALATIFGSRAIAGANVLYQNGAKGIDKWTKAVNDQGFATEQAEGKMDSLEGDVKKLSAAFDTALIKSGSAANDVLRDLVTGLTGAVQGFSNLPPIVQQGALAMTALVAVTALAGGGFILAIPKLVEFQGALRVLSASEIPAVAAAATRMMGATTKAASAMAATAKFLTGPWGVALAAAVVGVDLLSKYLDSLQASSEQITNSLKSATSAAQIFATAGQGKDVKWLTDVQADLKDLPAVLQASADQSANLFARFDSSHFGAFDALKQIGVQLGTLATSDLPAAQHAFSLLADKTDGSQKELWRLINTMPAYKDALTAQATALGINVTTTNDATNKKRLLELAQGTGATAAKEAAAQTAKDSEALAKLEGKADDSKSSIDDLTEAINNFGKGALDVDAASNQFQQAIDDMTDSIEKNGQTLDLNTQEGRDNDSALRSIATSALGLASAQAAAGASQDTLTASMATGRQAFIDAATAAGLTTEQANALADQYGLIPANVTTAIGATGVDVASAQVQGWINLVNSVPGYKLTHIGVAVDPIPDWAKNGIAGPAAGGTIYRAGGGGVPRYAIDPLNPFKPHGTDTVPAMLTPGEEVITAVQAAKYRPLLKAINSGSFGFDSGGTVPTYVSAPPQYMTAPSTSAAPAFNVVLSQKGGVDLLKYVDVSIQRADQSNYRTGLMGKQRGGLG